MKEKISSFLNKRKFILIYILIYLVVIIFPISHYPNIYGVDSFELIWMAKAIKNGIFFSEKSWLITIWSYFGYYPFSHRAIGVPFIFSLLNIFVESIGFGVEEAILIYDLIFIFILLISIKFLAEKVFSNNKWYQIILISSFLLSPNIITDVTMTISSRLYITLESIIFLNFCIKYLRKEDITFYDYIILFIISLIGLFSHRLWTVSFIPLFILVVLIIFMKYPNILRLFFYITIPLSILLLFLGYTFLSVDSEKILSPWFHNSNVLGLAVNLTIHYYLQVGLILSFFPIGIIFLYRKTCRILLKTNKSMKSNSIINSENLCKNYNLIPYYFILLITFFYFSIFSFYTIVVFLPIIIIISIIGLQEIMNILNQNLKSGNFFKIKRNIYIPFFLYIGSLLYTFLYNRFWNSINSKLIIFVNLFIIFVLVVFLVISLIPFNKLNIRKFKIFSYHIKRILILLSVLSFSMTTVIGKIDSIENSPYPWENRYFTDEEEEIVSFFSNKDIDGIIYVTPEEIAKRISGIGFLPAFNKRSYIGSVIYYDIISSSEVKEKTVINTLSEIIKMNPLYFNETNPITEIKNIVRHLNVSNNSDYNVLLDFRIQYIISVNPEYFNISYNPFILDLSLSSEFIPIFLTKHLYIYKIF